MLNTFISKKLLESIRNSISYLIFFAFNLKSYKMSFFFKNKINEIVPRYKLLNFSFAQQWKIPFISIDTEFFIIFCIETVIQKRIISNGFLIASMEMNSEKQPPKKIDKIILIQYNLWIFSKTRPECMPEIYVMPALSCV